MLTQLLDELLVYITESFLNIIDLRALSACSKFLQKKIRTSIAKSIDKIANIFSITTAFEYRILTSKLEKLTREYVICDQLNLMPKKYI